MGKTNKHEFTKVVTGTGAVSGSIVAISDLASGVIDQITFGTYVQGSTDINHQTYTTNITLANVANDMIEGPISNFKLASGTAIIHYNGQLG